MDPKSSGQEKKPGVSKVKLAVGAASLFLFIVGLKRTFRMDDPGGTRIADEADEVPEEPEEPEERRPRRRGRGRPPG